MSIIFLRSELCILEEQNKDGNIGMYCRYVVYTLRENLLYC